MGLQVKHERCAPVPVVRKRLEAGLGRGGKRDFGGGEEGADQNEEQQRGDLRH